jgi:cyanophycinase
MADSISKSRRQLRKHFPFIAALLLPMLFFAEGSSAAPKFRRDGNKADSIILPHPGYALMGGGKQDAAFKFLCDSANGGDFLVLTADADDAYMKQENEKFNALCPLNSVTTLSFEKREDAEDPAAAEMIDQAESIFITGGDQSDYVRFWQDTPIEAALNRHIAANKPIGGSSAGLAILGEFSFASMIDTIHSPEALANPYGNKVTISRDFLRIPLLADLITDTHFVKRDRLGRLLVFMARILQDGWAKKVRAIAVEENAAVLVSPTDGTARVIGGPAYFLEATRAPEVCAYRQPLTFSDISVQHVAEKQTFQLKTWQGPTAERYTLSVAKGVVTPTGKTSSGLY